MLLFKLAYRNLVGAKLRTWLNVGVLSFCYVLIIWHQGFFSGMLRQGTQDKMDDEIGGGQYWHGRYDPFDPMTLEEAHGKLPPGLRALAGSGEAAAILIRQASIFPGGRMQSILIKGIDPAQKVLKIPSEKLAETPGAVPVLAGRRMARKNALKEGEFLTVRFRDAGGTFDAVECRIAGIIQSNVPTIDVNQLWLPLETMRKLTGMADEATIAVIARGRKENSAMDDWAFKDTAFLLEDINSVVRSKRTSSGIFYTLLLFLAVIAVFDTQILSIFKRRKEIGTLAALGMTKLRIIMLFTLEGAMNGILAAALGTVYGGPLLWYTAKYGFEFPLDRTDYGIALASRIMPVYPLALIVFTAAVVMFTVTIVSYLPSRQIARMKPTDALKGKLS